MVPVEWKFALKSTGCGIHTDARMHAYTQVHTCVFEEMCVFAQPQSQIPHKHLSKLKLELENMVGFAFKMYLEDMNFTTPRILGRGMKSDVEGLCLCKSHFVMNHMLGISKHQKCITFVIPSPVPSSSLQGDCNSFLSHMGNQITMEFLKNVILFRERQVGSKVHLLCEKSCTTGLGSNSGQNRDPLGRGLPPWCPQGDKRHTQREGNCSSKVPFTFSIPFLAGSCSWFKILFLLWCQ